jgi:hypothetical protein
MLARQIAIGFGVAIVFPLLVYYGVSTFSPAPKWNDFHEQVVYAPNPTRDELIARQEKQKAETAAWTEANRVFSLRLLCLAAPLGYLAILLGSLRIGSGLGTGFMFGGIFAATTGYWFHWSYLDDSCSSRTGNFRAPPEAVSQPNPTNPRAIFLDGMDGSAHMAPLPSVSDVRSQRGSVMHDR